MRNRPARRILLAAALASALVAAAVASAANGRQHASRAPAAVPGSIIVGFKNNVSAKGRAGVLGAVGARPTKRFAQIDSTVVSVSPANTSWTIRTLEQDPRVAYAEPNFVLHAADTPNDPSFTQEWGLNNTGQQVNFTTGTADADIDAKEAWSVSTGSPDVTVAIIDTGVDVTHPDLAQNIWINQGENCAGCRTNGIDDDGDGYVDDWRGWDFVNHDNNPTDDNGHGTHVAGHDRRGRQQRHRRDRRDVEQHDHAAQVPRLEWIRVDRGRDQRDPLRARQGRPDHEQLVGRRRLLAGAPGRDRADGLERRALRRGRGQRLHEHGRRAVLAVELRHAEHHLGRRQRPVRPQGLVLELRRAHGRPLGTGHERLLDVEGLDLPLRGRDVDGGPARLGCGRACQGGVPECERCRPEGFAPAHGRPDRRAQRRQQDGRSAERRPRRSLHGTTGVDRVACERRRAQRRRPGRGARRRRAMRLAGRRFGDRDAERKPVPARRAWRRPLRGDLHAFRRRGQPERDRDLGNGNRHAERVRDGRPDVRDRSWRQSGHDRDALGRRECVAHVRRPGEPAGRPEDERRHDRAVAVLLDLRLDLQAGWHSARLADARRHERRLRRHEGAARDRPLQDPGRPPGDVDGLDDAHAVRRPAGRERRPSLRVALR